MKFARYMVLVLLLLNSTGAFAQPEQLTDIFYSSGKIYVVTGSLLLILAGIIIYLIRLDRKIKKLEKELEDRQS